MQGNSLDQAVTSHVMGVVLNGHTYSLSGARRMGKQDSPVSHHLKRQSFARKLESGSSVRAIAPNWPAEFSHVFFSRIT